MLQHIIDRRLAGRNKSVGNRERFLKRYKQQIQDAVRRAIDGRSIRDVARGEDIRISRRDTREPVFQHGSGGRREMVHPGNRDYLRGDRIQRPQGGGGSGGGGSGQASDSGSGEDDFVFALSKEEFLQVFFEDLALPHLVRTQLTEVVEWTPQRAGYSSDGTPNNLHIVRSLRGAIGRRIAIGAGVRAELAELEQCCDALSESARQADPALQAQWLEMQERIRHLRARLLAIPFLDPIDLRFRNRVRVPVPSSKAVMFCVMDVSGSMDEARKDLSKRFFILLYLFLTRHYEHIEIVFIRHHTQAQEVDEDTFFHAKETGGTVVSSALHLMADIIRKRYPRDLWNIYGAQASDGDNWHQDSGLCRQLLQEQILPACRYFAYIQVAAPEQNLWEEYARLAEEESGRFAMRKAVEVSQIYPVFRDLFRKEGARPVLKD